MFSNVATPPQVGDFTRFRDVSVPIPPTPGDVVSWDGTLNKLVFGGVPPSALPSSVELNTNRNVPLGYAALDAGGRITSARLPDPLIGNIQLRQGTLAALMSITLAMGEPGFSTDTNAFFIGNDSAVPGVPIGGRYFPLSIFLGYDPAGGGGTGSGDGVELALDGIHRRGVTADLPLKLEIKGNSYFLLYRSGDVPGTTVGNNSIDFQTRRVGGRCVESADSFAFGANNQIRTAHNLALGEDNISNSLTDHSVVIGFSSSVFGSRAIVIGYNSFANNNDTLVFGSNSTALTLNATVLGNGCYAGSNATVAGGGTSAAAIHPNPAIRNAKVTLSGADTIVWPGDHTDSTGDFSISVGVGVLLSNFNVASVGSLRTIVQSSTFDGTNTNIVVSPAFGAGPTAAVLNVENSGGASSGTALGRNAKTIGFSGTVVGNNQRNVVDRTTILGGPLICRVDSGEVTGLSAFQYLGGGVAVLQTGKIDFKTVQTVTITFPPGCRFVPFRGVIAAKVVTTLVTQPTIQVGISGTTNKYRASAITTHLTASWKVEVFDITSDDGDTSLAIQITGGADAATFIGSLLLTGLLMEDL